MKFPKELKVLYSLKAQFFTSLPQKELLNYVINNLSFYKLELVLVVAQLIFLNLAESWVKLHQNTENLD